jgi:hypothetical protein
MHDVAVIIQDLLLFLGVLIVAFVALVVFISRLSGDNPLKQILTAVSLRICATLAAGFVAIPIEPIPGMDVLYDLGMPIVLLFYWATLVRSLMRTCRAVQPTLRQLPLLPGGIE